MDIWHLIISVAGPIVGMVVKHILGEKKWDRVREGAEQIIKDPAKTNNVKEAVTESFMDIFKGKFQKVEDKIVNGSNPVKKI